MTPSLFLTSRVIKQNTKPTATPLSTVISAADNHFLLPSDDNNNYDADPADLMGKYYGGGKKKGKGEHRRRYEENNSI